MSGNKRKEAESTVTRHRCMEDRQFRRWYETLKLKNETTAGNYCMGVIRLTQYVGLDPLSYVALHDEDREEFEDVTQDILNAMVTAGRAESTIQTGLSMLRHWSEWCRCKWRRKLVMGKAPRKPIASKQHIPAQDNLRVLLDHLDPRGRVCMAFRALAGLRPGILGNRWGTDGLRLEHLEGLTLTQRGTGYRIKGKSLKVNVPAELSKNGMAFYSFLGGEGIDYLRAYLDKRIADGERLAPDSPVIVPSKHSNRDGSYRFVKRDTLTDPISDAMKRAGLKETPYIWRSYFKTQLIIAQSRKGLLWEYVEFWMGHDGGIRAVYSFHKKTSAEVIEEMRSAYETKALPFLQTRQAPGQDTTREDLLRVLMESFDVPKKVIDKLDLENAEPDALRDVIREHREAAQAKAEEAAPEPTPPVVAGIASSARQMVVQTSEVQGYVALGWRYVYEARLPEGQALIEAPTTPPGVGGEDVAVAAD